MTVGTWLVGFSLGFLVTFFLIALCIVYRCGASAEWIPGEKREARRTVKTLRVRPDVQVTADFYNHGQTMLIVRVPYRWFDSRTWPRASLALWLAALPWRRSVSPYLSPTTSAAGDIKKLHKGRKP